MKLESILEEVDYRRDNLGMEVIKLSDIDRVEVNEHTFIRKAPNPMYRAGELFQENIEYMIDVDATGQLLERLGIRGAYRNISNNPTFRDHWETPMFLNTMIQFAKRARLDKKIKLIINNDVEEIVGVVGPKYEQTRHADVIYQAIDHFGTSAIDERTSYINNKVMHVSFEPVVQRDTDVKVGDAIGFGPTIINSDNGHSKVGVGLFLMILRCTNGMVMPKKFLDYGVAHRGEGVQRKFDTFLGEIFQMDTLGVKFIDYVNQIADRPPILLGPEEMPNIIKRYNIPQKHNDGLIEWTSLDNDDLPLNTYGIFNAINGYATHKVQDEEESISLMQAAFNILQIGVDYM